jgi:dTDP-4-amino-4,6-dideoxygalactose transaminase
MKESIPCANPQRQFSEQSDDIHKAIRRVLDSGSYVLGSEVEKFEEEFAGYVGSSHCIGVNSGTDALILSLRALGISSGDEVITPSHTAVATVSAILSCGATPVFVDIDSTSFTIDPALANEAVTSRTRAIVVVHLYGHPCDMDALQNIALKHRIHLVEDCAQAHGAEWRGRKVGTFGTIGCFSFYPTKNLGAIGDGGAIVTNDSNIADRIRRLRQYGWDSERVSVETSGVSRLDEIQAAILRVKLPFLESQNARRRQIAKEYSNRLEGFDFILPTEKFEAKHVFHLFVVRVQKRNDVLLHLNSLGIFPGIHYALPVHLHPSYKKFAAFDNDKLKTTELISEEILSLPMFPELNDIEIERVWQGMLSVR